MVSSQPASLACGEICCARRRGKAPGKANFTRVKAQLPGVFQRSSSRFDQEIVSSQCTYDW